MTYDETGKGRGYTPPSDTAETFDQKVGRAMALLSAVETAKETGTPVEIAGVKAYPCDDRGRISPHANVEFWPEDVDMLAPMDRPAEASARGFDTKDLPRGGVVLNHPQRRVREEADVITTLPAGFRPASDPLVTVEGKATRLYTAGCISGDDRPFEEKAAVFREAAAVLRQRGYGVVNPLEVGNDHCLHGQERCQEETMRRLKGGDQGAGHSWECYLRHDLIEALRCDGVALLPGWERSPGARMEFDVLTRVGIPARPVEEWLDDRPVVVGVDPATGTSVTAWRDGDVLHVTGFSEEVVATHDFFSGNYCARCRVHEDNHGPGGSRYGCEFAGPGTTSHCNLCQRPIIWDGRSWGSDDQDMPHVCAASTRPDVAHEPMGTGEQR